MATHPIIATFLLIIFSTSMTLTMAQVVITEIYDTDGDIVLTGKPYYILPVVQRQGGGISTAPRSANNACPLTVVQETATTALGIPVKLYSKGKSTQNVTFSKDMNVVFGAAISCGEPPIWKLDDHSGTRFVGLGGKFMAKRPKFVNNWFKIERFFPRFHFDYKLTFCPNKTICPTCETNCGDLGVIKGDGTWRLGASDTTAPLRIKFKKA